MRIGEIGERKIIKLIEGVLRRDPKIYADFDEDAAIFNLGKGKIAVTTDMGLMGTHFLTEDPRKIGKKIVVSCLTDLLAKGAMPLYMFVCLGLPEKLNVNFVKFLYKSMDSELKKYDAYLIGGDTNKSREFVYSVTLIGKVKRPVLRKNAKEGDYVVLTGDIGSAAAGYLMLKRGLKGHENFVKAQCEPEIDFELCKKIIPRANAGIDISDGLAFELGEISRLSRKKIVIYWDKLPLHPRLPSFCKKNGLNVEDLVFHHGEDYQIVYTTKNPNHGIVIGKAEKGKDVFLIKDGKKRKIEPKGYEHFVSN
jgi:thiamine-monophosphate kinase